jgi:hypothetical protein
MKIRTTFALAVTTLSLGVPVATAAPDGYQPDAIARYLANNGPDGFQPQLHTSTQPDAVDRYVANSLRQAGEPDAIARYLRNHPSGAEPALDLADVAGHPDSRAVRPGVSFPVKTVEADGFSWTGVALGTLGGALIILLAVAGASAMRERRRLVLR